MKVLELIELLEKCDPDMDIYLGHPEDIDSINFQIHDSFDKKSLEIF